MDELWREEVLVTGGAGFIGAHLANRLVSEGCQVWVLDDMSAGHRENLLPANGLLGVIVGDILDDAILDRVFGHNYKYIFHLAASFANQRSLEYPVRDLMVNAIGTLKLLERAKRLPDLRRFVYASSSCVLGASNSPLIETSPLAPETPYAVSKLAGENYSRVYYMRGDVPATVVRYFNVYGPGDRHGIYRSVIPNFIHKALQGEALFLMGTGEETRDFLYVADAVEATIRAAIRSCTTGEIFNLGTGVETKIVDLANMINHIAGNDAGTLSVPTRTWDRIPRRVTSTAKAESELCFRPRTTIERGLRRTVEWFKSTGDYLNEVSG